MRKFYQETKVAVDPDPKNWEDRVKAPGDHMGKTETILAEILTGE